MHLQLIPALLQAADDTGIDVVSILNKLLPFVPEKYRPFVAIGLFVLGTGGYMYVSGTETKDDDAFFARYFGGFRKLWKAPIDKDPPTPA